MARPRKEKIRTVEFMLGLRLGEWHGYNQISEVLFDNLTYIWKDPVQLVGDASSLTPLDDLFMGVAWYFAGAPVFLGRAINAGEGTPTEDGLHFSDPSKAWDWRKLQKSETFYPPGYQIENRCLWLVTMKWLDCVSWREPTPEVPSRPALARPTDIAEFVHQEANYGKDGEAGTTVAAEMSQRLLKEGWVTRIDHPTDARSYFLVPTTSLRTDDARYFVSDPSSTRLEKNLLHRQANELMQHELLRNAAAATSTYRPKGFPEPAVEDSSFTHGFGYVPQIARSADYVDEEPNVFVEFFLNAIDEVAGLKPTLTRDLDKYIETDWFGSTVAGGVGSRPARGDKMRG